MSTEFMMDQLDILRQEFKTAAFAYFVNNDRSNHFIVIDNNVVTEEERFIDIQFEVTDRFYYCFPGETLSFITKDRLALLKTLEEVDGFRVSHYEWTQLISETDNNFEKNLATAGDALQCGDIKYALAA